MGQSRLELLQNHSVVLLQSIYHHLADVNAVGWTKFTNRTKEQGVHIIFLKVRCKAGCLNSFGGLILKFPSYFGLNLLNFYTSVNNCHKLSISHSTIVSMLPVVLVYVGMVDFCIKPHHRPQLGIPACCICYQPG